MARVVLVTGTDTGVGKTIATAALAATATGRVAVVKPVQTGCAEPEPWDADTVGRLAGLASGDAVTLRRLDAPLAPDAAARLQGGVALPTVAEHAGTIRELADDYDTVIVEGAGGLLVRLDNEGGTLLDLAASLARQAGLAVEVVVVCRAGLGTLNHTELTVAALRSRGLEPSGLIIGAWPADPGLAETSNLDDLPRGTGVPVLAVLPDGAGALSSAEFVAAAPDWFADLADLAHRPRHDTRVPQNL